MIAENLITTAVLPLQTSDTGKDSLEVMENFNVRHLPIVNNSQLPWPDQRRRYFGT